VRCKIRSSSKKFGYYATEKVLRRFKHPCCHSWTHGTRRCAALHSCCWHHWGVVRPLSVSSTAMDDLACMGCSKAFSSQKRLSSHEAQCDKLHIFKKSLSKSRRKKRKLGHDDVNEVHEGVDTPYNEPTDPREELPTVDDMHVSSVRPRISMSH